MNSNDNCTPPDDHQHHDDHEDEDVNNGGDEDKDINHGVDEDEDTNHGVARIANDHDDNDLADANSAPTIPEETQSLDDRKPAAKLLVSNDKSIDKSMMADEKAIYRRTTEIIDNYAAAVCDTYEREAPKFDRDLEKGKDDDDDDEQNEFCKSDETPCPPVARANEKGTIEPLTTSGGPRRYGRQRASAPGAEYVRGRAPGARPQWYVQQLRRESMGRRVQAGQISATETAVPDSRFTTTSAQVTVLLQESAPRQTKKVHRKYYIYASIGVCLMVAIAAGLGIALSTSGGKSGGQVDSTTRFDPFTQDCSVVLAQTQPNVLAQCRCRGSIYEVASDITARYQTLAKTFAPTVFPDFRETLQSCSPRNQALVWLASGDGMPTEPTMRQRYLLALLFITWSGPSWMATTEWLSANEECSWSGVACDTNNEVSEISLVGKNLTGQLGSNLALITSLTSVTLDQNSLQGTLSPELVSLSSLQVLSLDYNMLSGSIPSVYGKWIHLSSLTLTYNNLVGTLPFELAVLTKLQVLALSNNRINGTIPSEFSQLESLRSVVLENNTLTGSLPTEIGLWKSVELIDFSLNNFFGSTIPSEIGSISNLTSLRLFQSGLNGTLPMELFGIGNLSMLSLPYNNLHGSIPTEIGRLSNLRKWNAIPCPSTCIR
jgi:hypothetical protein